MQPGPAAVAVSAADPALYPAAAALAARLGLPLLPSPEEAGEEHPASPLLLVLVLTPQRLELSQSGRHAPGPVHVELLSGRLGYRLRHGGGRRQAIARAVGLKAGQPPPTVIDATGGLARDAAVLAGLGCRVTIIERSPLIHALLADGLQRALADPEADRLLPGNLRLLLGDSRAILADPATPTDEVVYLDPMFPHRAKSSLVKKEMRLLRLICGDDPDADSLLAAALAHAGRRVVVKRPAGAPPLAGPTPSLVIPGQSSRFDVYLRPGKPSERNG